MASLVFFVVAPSFVLAAETPTQVVKAKSDRITKELALPSKKRNTKELEKELRTVLDLEELAKRALTGHWEKRTPEEQREFVDLLDQLLLEGYHDRLRTDKVLKGDYSIQYTGEKVRSDRAIVKSTVRVKDSSKPVDYKLLQKNGKWVVYDIVIDDIGLEETYREAYVEIIEEEGWSGLITRMKDLLAERRAEKK